MRRGLTLEKASRIPLLDACRAGAEALRTRRDLAIALVVLSASAGLAGIAGMLPRRALPFVTDEFAYLLQADTFAHGALSLPAPRSPEFFEAAQVLVTPRYMAKYPPGNALAIAPFSALGAPWLWPCLAFGACAALIFVAGRQLGAPWPIAAFGAAAFSMSKLTLLMLPTYLSHCTSTLAALGALVLAARAVRLQSAGSAAGAGACVAFALLTRPYTAIACGLALALVFLGRRAPLRSWLAALAPLAVAAALLCVFNAATTGSWRKSAWQLYAEQYTPADGPGFGPVPPPAVAPRRPAHLRRLLDEYERNRVGYLLSDLPHHALVRADAIVNYFPLRALVVLSLLGLVAVAQPPVAFALAWLLALFGLQLTFHASWPQYHADEYAPLVVLAVAGLHAAVRGLEKPILLALLIGAQLLAYSFFWNVAALPALALIALLLSLVAVAALRRPRLPAIAAAMLRYGSLVLVVAACLQMPQRVAELGGARSRYESLRARFAALREVLRPRHALLFVRGAPEKLLELPLVNPGLGVRDPEPIVAVDLGPRDAELLAQYPDRQPLLLDVDAWTVQALGPTASR